MMMLAVIIKLLLGVTTRSTDAGIAAAVDYEQAQPRGKISACPTSVIEADQRHLGVFDRRFSSINDDDELCLREAMRDAIVDQEPKSFLEEPKREIAA